MIPTSVSASSTMANTNKRKAPNEGFISEPTKRPIHPLPPPPYIVKSYRSEQAGLPIEDDQVVRAINGKYYCIGEQASHYKLSTAGLPTYGNCNQCWRSGPLNKRCGTCNTTDAVFGEQYLFHPKMRTAKRVFDAEYLAILFGVGDHEVAKADRRYSWTQTNARNMGTDTLRIRGDKRRKTELLAIQYDSDE
jgi:hypothetical protein